MSHPTRDCGEAHRELGERLDEFLYKNGNTRDKEKIAHTYGELWDMLESIRVDAWDSYDDIANHMGWNG